MKYGVHNSNDNINITVTTMDGTHYYLVTENDDEVYGDIKDALRPHLKVLPKPARHQLVFLTKDNVELNDDKRLSSTLSKSLELKVLIKEPPEWDDIQQDIIRKMSGEVVSVSHIETPGEMEAFLWSIENNDLKALTLSRKTNMVSIIDAIRRSGSLQSLTISENNLNHNHIIALSDALRENDTIQSLTLNKNGMTENDIIEFSKMIGKNTSLRELTISENYFENGMNALSRSLGVNTSLRKIAIIDCDIIDEDLVELSLLLHENTNTTLQEINLSKNRISDEGVSNLASSLEKNTTITSLDLSDNNITYKGASALAEIIFENTNNLQKLILSKNRISDKGASFLASSLQETNSITSLDLSSNNIGYTGASSLAKMIFLNTALKELHVEDNDLTENGRKEIREALQNNEIQVYYDGMME
jgi:Ran GTPase-activating protein (RanGAP) involved in mRNA processing and transport